ncbi:epoxide hydrolase [Nonomuraea sp. 3-1Str]|uniref:epoxide hydrolase family protein n=1 Tax=Nonomuraea sp. 3-1Str TaxID=2929801 RepID=UPI00285C0BE6|nr:epoxide hydrolase [Nonomuraea sp. 3-1Str]MDR8408301.1 epoxide hydrolase [Nonomuraea sp. 3-1Str]
MNHDLTPFRIDVPQSALDELARRLDAARWPDELPDAGWDYGVAPGHLRELAGYWRDGYDWRRQERRLNELPQYTTEIDGQNVHFAHVRSPEPNAVPLLVTHGWPSTVADFLDIVRPLTEPGEGGAPAFHLVLPSLPGFGFSGPTRERGWDVTRIARAWAELMRRLGYDRYIVQGGDFGSLISPEVARVAPEHVMGVHLNAMVTASTPAPGTSGLTQEELAKARATAEKWRERSGYATIQSTRPQTLAYALTDSPLGLLAWNLEWFVDYDPSRAVQTPVDRDAILTNVTTFWLTRTAGSSMRLYKEAGAAFGGGPRPEAPTAVALFPGDSTIRTLAERQYAIVRWTEYDRGGHFASLQAPDLLVEDVRAFARALQ